jgi:hypothetical protein
MPSSPPCAWFWQKLWLNFIHDGSDCIDFGIDHLHDCLSASLSLSSHTTSHAATSTPAPGHDIDHGNPSRGSIDQGCGTHALGYLDIGTRATTSHEHLGFLYSPSIRDATSSTTLPLRLRGSVSPLVHTFGFSPV